MSGDLEQIGKWVNGVGIPGLLAVGIYALHRGLFITGREYERAVRALEKLRDEDGRRFEELKAERDEWKRAALRNLSVAERAVDTAAKAADGTPPHPAAARQRVKGG